MFSSKLNDHRNDIVFFTIEISNLTKELKFVCYETIIYRKYVINIVQHILETYSATIVEYEYTVLR